MAPCARFLPGHGAVTTAMADIWSGIGVEISQGGGDSEWLYKVSGQTRGPVPMQSIVQKLISGEINLNTEVAREGGEFHPIARVAAFSKHVTEAKKHAQKRAAKKVRRIVAILSLPGLVALGVGGFYVWKGIEKTRAERKIAQQKAAEELAKKRAEAEQTQMGLVALVSLGTEEDVKIKSAPSGGKKPKTKTGEPGSSTKSEPEEEMVATCKLSQQDIFGTLRKHLGKINVCVEDEKSRDTQGLLPPQLELEFVVQTSDKVTDFQINDRHYRKGPMNNCMIKAFATFSFPSSNGANCPVTIPIKIGK